MSCLAVPRSLSPTRCNSFSAGASADRVGTPSSTRGNDTFSTTVSIGTKLKNWNTNPRLRRRNAASAPALIAHRSWPATARVPVSGASSGDMQEGRFTGSGWSGDDDEFACVQSDVEVDEHVHLLVAPAVLLGGALELQRRHRIAAVSACRDRCTPRTSPIAPCGSSMSAGSVRNGVTDCTLSRAMAACSRKASRRGA